MKYLLAFLTLAAWSSVVFSADIQRVEYVQKEIRTCQYVNGELQCVTSYEDVPIVVKATAKESCPTCQSATATAPLFTRPEGPAFPVAYEVRSRFNEWRQNRVRLFNGRIRGLIFGGLCR